MKHKDILDDTQWTEAELRTWFGTNGPPQLAQQIHFDTARFYQITMRQSVHSNLTRRVWWASTGIVSLLLVAMGSFLHHQGYSGTARHVPARNSPAPLLRRPHDPIPPTILGKEEQLLSYQPRWIQQQWLDAHRPPIKYSTWAPEDTGGYGWYYFYTGPHSNGMMGENQVILNVHPHLAWHGPITATK